MKIRSSTVILSYCPHHTGAGSPALDVARVAGVPGDVHGAVGDDKRQRFISECQRNDKKEKRLYLCLTEHQLFHNSKGVLTVLRSCEAWNDGNKPEYFQMIDYIMRKSTGVFEQMWKVTECGK